MTEILLTGPLTNYMYTRGTGQGKHFKTFFSYNSLRNSFSVKQFGARSGSAIMSWAEGYKTFFVLNSTENKMYHAY